MISGLTLHLSMHRARGPMTKEEYERQQSVVRRVFDPDTGRHRLVKGDGEIIEEIVSREQQKAINKVGWIQLDLSALCLVSWSLFLLSASYYGGWTVISSTDEKTPLTNSLLLSSYEQYVNVHHISTCQSSFYQITSRVEF